MKIERHNPRYSAIAAILVLSVCTSASADPQGAESSERTLCTSAAGDDTRKIETISTPPSSLPCRTLYTKSGQTEVIADSQHTSGICESAAESVISNLVAAGFDCQPD